MSTSDRQAGIDSLRKTAAKAMYRLTDAIIDACPGEHSTIQHRDMRPPWCPRRVAQQTITTQGVAA